jgi:hypothetical protein
MADQAVTLNLSNEVIDAHVRAAVAQVLNRDPEGLVRAVVDAALAQKRPGAYSSEPPIWQEQVNAMIREVAEATWKEWIDEQRPKIQAAIRARLDSRQKKDLIAKVCDRLDGALGNFRVRIDLE